MWFNDYPKSNSVEEDDLGKEKGMIDQFLLLGFGSTSRRDLQDAYTIGWAATKP